jgi:hypothetical protein
MVPLVRMREPSKTRAIFGAEIWHATCLQVTDSEVETTRR